MRRTHTSHAGIDVAIATRPAHIRLVANTASMHHGAKPMTILPNLAQQNELLKAQIAEMQAQLAQANQPKRLTMKVSEKGALSIYGLGRFPVTLYRGQWERLATAMPDIKVFMSQNAALLATKD